MYFYIKQYAIPLYAVMLIVAFISMFLFIGISLHKYKVSFILIGYSLIITTFCVVSGAVIFHVLTSFKGEFEITNIGLSSYGGAIGLILSTFLFVALYKNNRSEIISIHFLAIPLMYGISKLGCFWGGCCYGIPYDKTGYVQYDIYNTPTIPLFPVQLVESVTFLLIFLLCCYLFFYKKFKYTLETLIICCAVAKFYLDYLRYSHIEVGISVNQIVSLIFIGIAFVSLIVKTLIPHNEK